MYKELKVLFGERVAKLRKLKGLSQEKLSEQIDVSVSTLSNIETGSFFTQYKNIDKIAKALGVEVRELFNFDNTNNKEQNLKAIYDKIEFIKDDEDKVAILYDILSRFF